MPPTVTVIVADVVVETGFVAMANVPRVAPDFTVAELGTTAAAVFDETVIGTPELPAGSGIRT